MREILQIFKRWGVVKGIRVLLQIGTKKFRSRSGIPLADENYRIRDIEKHGYTIKLQNDLWLIRNADVAMCCRIFTSDIEVFYQIFIYDEFKDLVQLLRSRNIGIKTMIDAGSNIGLSILMLQKKLGVQTIVGIEPDHGNFSLLRHNLSLNNINAALVNSGIWNKSCRLYFDRSFRDGKEWSIALSEEPVSEQYVDSISLDDLLKEHKLASLDLLKIDIEGAERYVFNNEEIGMGFLDKTRVLAIEIHEEFHIRDRILEALRKRNFRISQSGEYIIGYKE